MMPLAEGELARVRQYQARRLGLVAWYFMKPAALKRSLDVRFLTTSTKTKGCEVREVELQIVSWWRKLVEWKVTPLYLGASAGVQQRECGG